MKALQITKPNGSGDFPFRVVRSRQPKAEVTMSSPKVEAVFNSWCRLNEQERAEFDQRVVGVQSFLKAQTQSNAGTKAAATRKANNKKTPEPPILAKAAGEQV